MRTAFIRSLIDLAERDERIMLLVGDLGFGVVEPFADRFPKQFLNPGVAEQNMTGLAVGLSMMGKIVFTYSIANFPVIRCLEQLRNDACYHRANVKVVAVGGGYSYGSLGMSHHATEDLAIMRAMPGMTVVAPGDPIETEAATRAIASHEGPCYLRLGKTGERVIHASTSVFRLGKAIMVRDGHDLTLITTGAMLDIATKAASLLAQDGIEARILSMHTLKPLDTGAISAAASQTGAIATIEEHSIIGGLGSAVAEWLAENSRFQTPFKRIGLPSAFSDTVGSQDYMRRKQGLSEQAIAHSLRALITTNAVSASAFHAVNSNSHR